MVLKANNMWQKLHNFYTTHWTCLNSGDNEHRPIEKLCHYKQEDNKCHLPMRILMRVPMCKFGFKIKHEVNLSPKGMIQKYDLSE